MDYSLRSEQNAADQTKDLETRRETVAGGVVDEQYQTASRSLRISRGRAPSPSPCRASSGLSEECDCRHKKGSTSAPAASSEKGCQNCRPNKTACFPTQLDGFTDAGDVEPLSIPRDASNPRHLSVTGTPSSLTSVSANEGQAYLGGLSHGNQGRDVVTSRIAMSPARRQGDRSSPTTSTIPATFTPQFKPLVFKNTTPLSNMLDRSRGGSPRRGTFPRRRRPLDGQGMDATGFIMQSGETDDGIQSRSKERNNRTEIETEATGQAPMNAPNPVYQALESIGNLPPSEWRDLGRIKSLKRGQRLLEQVGEVLGSRPLTKDELFKKQSAATPEPHMRPTPLILTSEPFHPNLYPQAPNRDVPRIPSEPDSSVLRDQAKRVCMNGIMKLDPLKSGEGIRCGMLVSQGINGQLKFTSNGDPPVEDPTYYGGRRVSPWIHYKTYA